VPQKLSIITALVLAATCPSETLAKGGAVTFKGGARMHAYDILTYR